MNIEMYLFGNDTFQSIERTFILNKNELKLLFPKYKIANSHF